MNPNNSKTKQYNQQLILIALSDGKWHRNMELKAETKLFPHTLSKHLKELEKELHWIERKEDTESGEYPHPVLYRASHSKVSYAVFAKSVIDNADDIEADLKEKKDPLQILDELHKINQYYFALILKEIQKRKHMTQKQLDYTTNLFICQPYEIYIKELITAFSKAIQIGTQFDINQLLQNHSAWQTQQSELHPQLLDSNSNNQRSKTTHTRDKHKN